MWDVKQLILDVGAGAGLVLCLLVVFLVDRQRSRDLPAAAQNTLEVRIIDDVSLRLEANKRLRLAVTPTFREFNKLTLSETPWDDMVKLLGELGQGYQFDIVSPKDMLTNPDLLDQYDVLFFTCAPGGEELRDQLSRFVGRGGTLYASDWRFDAVAAAFPDEVAPQLQGSGTGGEVLAEVVDPGLRDLLGNTITLRFDLPRWKTAAFRGPRTTTLIQGRYQKQQFPQDKIGLPAFAPLCVKFGVGKGTVIFTSFHNEKQNSQIEKKLLHYLVFSLVTADIDAQAASSIEKAGFAPQKSNLLSTPRESPSVRKTFSNSKDGPLRFILGFRNEGATLRLTLLAPDGRRFDWQGTSALILEIPQAPRGQWTYTVTAVHLPYDNFPFRVTLGNKN